MHPIPVTAQAEENQRLRFGFRHEWNASRERLWGGMEEIAQEDRARYISSTTLVARTSCLALTLPGP